MTTTASAIHPRTIQNRIAKAQRVVAFIQANPTIFADATDAETLSKFGPETWKLVNLAMGEKRPMSQLTIATVMGMLAGQAA